MAFADDSQVKASPAELHDAASTIRTIATNLENTLNDLKAYMKPIIDQYDAGSGDLYKDTQTDWDNSAAELQRVLRDIATATDNAADDYSITENANRSSWAR